VTSPYIPTDEGWLFLAVVIDALQMAWFLQRWSGQPDRVDVSQRSRSQYASYEFSDVFSRNAGLPLP